MRRTEEFIRKEVENRRARPYEVLLRLEGSAGVWSFGRFADADKAHAVGLAALRSTRQSDLPFGRRCLNYWVEHTLTGERVVRDAA